MITIREIAELANVSISTVSKIINNKDKNISAETRERVLKIVQERNYTPYANVKSINNYISKLIGVLICNREGHEVILNGIIRMAHKKGFGTIAYYSSSAEEEISNLEALCSHRVNGIIWDKSDLSTDIIEELMMRADIPYYVIDRNAPASDKSSYFSFKDLGYAAAKTLVDQRHRQVGCVVPHIDYTSSEFIDGFRGCLFSHELVCTDDMICVLDSHQDQLALWLRNLTGVVCIDQSTAVRICQTAVMQNIAIPAELSVVSLGNSKKEDLYYRVSTIGIPYEKFGEYIAEALISKSEKGEQNAPDIQYNYALNHNNSLSIPKTLKEESIVVIGSLNMDTLLSLERMPETGETVSVSERMIIPGGKGLNQALGATRLGANVHLIGKLGKDYDGSTIYEFLKRNDVDLEGIQSVNELKTGHAYIYICNDAESSISVFDGANSRLSKADIDRYAHFLDGASFCLLQTEIDQNVIAYAARLAQEKGVRTILKPCSVKTLDSELLKDINILVPNKKEIGLLVPGNATYEEKAQYMLDCGVETVIITLGADGCYLRDAEHSEYFDAAPFVPVDTTGAADAFISALAVYLSKGGDIKEVILHANFSAGLSTTRWGVPPGLVDQNTLEMHVQGSCSGYQNKIKSNHREKL